MKYILCVLLIISFNSKIQSQSNIEVGEKAPNIYITNWIKNAPQDKSLSDKYIVLEFWATWCGPCIAAVPHMNNLQKEFKSDHLYFISITDESVEKVERTLKRIDFHSIVVTDTTKRTQINFGDGEQGLEAYPMTVLINNKNVIEWIGRPNELDKKILTKFLTNKQFESGSLSSKTSLEIVKEKHDFFSLLSSKEIDYFFHIEPSLDGTASSEKIMQDKLIELNTADLKHIFIDVLNINPKRIEISPELLSQKYNLLYKNTGDSSLSMLENEILNHLNLKKTQKSKRYKIYELSITNPELLEETLEENFSAKSDADKTIIFTAYTLKDMINEINKETSNDFVINSTDETKYDFIIPIDSNHSVIETLKSYGISASEKMEEGKYIIINKIE